MINNFISLLKQKAWAYKKMKFKYKKLLKGPYRKDPYRKY